MVHEFRRLQARKANRLLARAKQREKMLPTGTFLVCSSSFQAGVKPHAVEVYCGSKRLIAHCDTCDMISHMSGSQWGTQAWLAWLQTGADPKTRPPKPPLAYDESEIDEVLLRIYQAKQSPTPRKFNAVKIKVAKHE